MFNVTALYLESVFVTLRFLISRITFKGTYFSGSGSRFLNVDIESVQ